MRGLKTMTTRGLYLMGLGVLGLHLGTAMPALADNDHDQCSNRTLKGTYIFTQDGTENRQVTAPPADRRPFGYAGIEKYDGRGNFTGINTLATARSGTSQPTVAVSEFVEYSGTYTVNPNCTVVWTSTDEDGFTSNYHLFLSPDGEKFTFISVSAEVIVEGTPTLVQEIVGVGTAYRSDR